MINNDIRDYVIESITNIDYLSNRFINDLLNIIYNKDYLNKIELKEKGVCTASYNVNKKKIEMYMNNIISYYKYIVNNGFINDNILSKNIIVLHTLIHEITHMNEFIDYTSNNYIRSILDISINNGKSERFYIKYHDIFPIEMHSEGESILFIKDIIDTLELNKIYFNYIIYLISNILELYKFKYKRLVPPIERYYKKINKLKDYYNLDISNIDILERFMYGIENDTNNLNISVNKLFNTTNIDFSELIRLKKI